MADLNYKVFGTITYDDNSVKTFGAIYHGASYRDNMISITPDAKEIFLDLCFKTDVDNNIDSSGMYHSMDTFGKQAFSNQVRDYNISVSGMVADIDYTQSFSVVYTLGGISYNNERGYRLALGNASMYKNIVDIWAALGVYVAPLNRINYIENELLLDDLGAINWDVKIASNGLTMLLLIESDKLHIVSYNNTTNKFKTLVTHLHPYGNAEYAFGSIRLSGDKCLLHVIYYDDGWVYLGDRAWFYEYDKVSNELSDEFLYPLSIGPTAALGDGRFVYGVDVPTQKIYFVEKQNGSWIIFQELDTDWHGPNNINVVGDRLMTRESDWHVGIFDRDDDGLWHRSDYISLIDEVPVHERYSSFVLAGNEIILASKYSSEFFVFTFEDGVWNRNEVQHPSIMFDGDNHEYYGYNSVAAGNSMYVGRYESDWSIQFTDEWRRIDGVWILYTTHECSMNSIVNNCTIMQYLGTSGTNTFRKAK